VDGASSAKISALARVAPHVAQSESERVSDTAVSPLRILIVDDHEAVRSGLRTLLSSSEWIISGEACDGLEAVEKTRSIRPDLIVMDISMPRMDGIAATRIIRQEIPEAEVIVISQNDPKVAAPQARDVNAHGYVSKSELSQSLLPMIRRLVEEKQAALSERELRLP
jgi:DNA-binding NarL/FixJ family response regulator